MQPGSKTVARRVHPCGKMRTSLVSRNPGARITVRGAGSIGGMKRAPLGGRRILTTIGNQTEVEPVYFISRTQADQIVVQDLPRALFVHADFIESFGGSFENRRVKSAREEGR